jgi:hypothetical protein
MGSGVHETSLGHMVGPGEVSAGFEGAALQMIMARDNPLFAWLSGSRGLPEAIISRIQEDNGTISLDGLGRRRGLSFSLSSAPRRAQTNVSVQVASTTSDIVAQTECAVSISCIALALSTLRVGSYRY